MADLVQVLVDTSATITQTFSVDGAPIDVDSGTPTVTATYPSGTALTPAPTVSGSWTGRTTGQYRFVLNAEPEVTWLDYEMTGTIGGKTQKFKGRVEWIGALLFTLDDLRKFRVGNARAFESAATWPNEQLQQARTAVLGEFTKILACSPVPRFRREKLNGDGSTCLNLPGLFGHKLLSVTINGVAQSLGGYEINDANQLEAIANYSCGTPFTQGRRNVVVEWAHGWEQLESEGPEGRYAAMVLAAKYLDPSGFSNAATVTTPDGVSFAFEPSEVGRGGYQRYTGVRDLDRWLNRHSQAGLVAV